MSRVEELLAEARQLPRPSAAKVAILEEAVRECDATGDEVAAFRVRGALTDEVYYTGDWDRFFVHFAWMLAQSDRDPDRFGVESLLWKYKWVVNNVASVPTIPLARIDELLDDLESRFRAAGSTMRAVHQHRMYVATAIGRDVEARTHFEAWWRAPRDWLSDCYACECDGRAAAFADLGERDRALDAWLTLIAEGKRCYHVPDNCRGRVLSHLWRRGEIDAAMHHHRIGLAKVKSKQGVATALARHIAFLVVIGSTSSAAESVRACWAEGARMPLSGDRLAFWTLLHFAVARLADARLQTITIPGDALPEALAKSVVRAKGGVEVPTDELRKWIDREARSLAAAFDRRNGNDHQTQLYARYPLQWER